VWILLHLCESAIHEQFDSGDITAVVGREKDHGLRNLVGSTEPTEPILMHAGDGKVGK